MVIHYLKVPVFLASQWFYLESVHFSLTLAITLINKSWFITQKVKGESRGRDHVPRFYDSSTDFATKQILSYKLERFFYQDF